MTSLEARKRWYAKHLGYVPGERRRRNDHHVERWVFFNKLNLIFIFTWSIEYWYRPSSNSSSAVIDVWLFRIRQLALHIHICSEYTEVSIKYNSSFESFFLDKIGGTTFVDYTYIGAYVFFMHFFLIHSSIDLCQNLSIINLYQV